MEGVDIFEIVYEHFETQPDLTYLDLTEHEIKSLDSIVELIAQFTHLEELNLAGNLFTCLPPDLSSWHSIANFNISNIQFDDFEQVVLSLATIPQLKSLYINLHEEN